MNHEAEIKNRILAKADEMFQHYGFSKVTMEEIASNLGISKKTLYKSFSNKEHILKEIVHNVKCEVESFVETLIADKKIEFMEKLTSFMNFLVKHSARFNTPMIQDLAKNHPQIWQEIQEFRKKKALKNFSKLLEEGIQKGIFRKDVNKEVIVLLYISAIHSLINPETLSLLPVSAEQVFDNILKIVFEGILSNDGKKKYCTSKLVFKHGELSK
jgi:AcrR family transcriptional regulator